MSVNFNGSNRWEAYYAGETPVIIPPGSPITVALWVNVTAFGSGESWSNPLCLLNESDSNKQLLFEFAHTGALYGYIYTGSGWTDIGNTTWNASTGKWHHLCIGVNANSRHFVVMDGDFSQTSWYNTAEAFGGATTVWFAPNVNGTNNFNGMIAHAAIWNAYLSPHEVRFLARGANPQSIRRGQLKHYWPLSHSGIQGGKAKIGRINVNNEYGDPVPTRGASDPPVRAFAPADMPVGLPETARDFTTASQQYLRVQGLTAIDYPFTVAAWARVDSLPTVGEDAKTIFGLGQESAGGYVSVDIKYTGALRSVNNIGGWQQGDTTNTVGAGEWFHAAIVYTSATNRRLILNGDWANSNQWTDSKTLSSLTRITLGVLNFQSDFYNFFDGQIAKAARWSSALSQNDIERLAAGALPSTVDAANLVNYWPLKGLLSPEPDDKGSDDLTLYAAPPLYVGHPKFSSRDFNGSTQYARNDAFASLAYPFSLSFWFNSPATLDQDGWIGLTYDNNNFVAVQGLSTEAVDVWIVSNGGTPYNGSISTSNAFTANTWSHVAVICASSTERHVVLNGNWASRGGGTGQTAAVFATAPNSIDVGRINAGMAANVDALIAHVAVWDVALTQQQVEELAARKNPLDVDPTNLVSYWPNTGTTSPERDVVGGYDLTLYGSPPQGASGPGVLDYVGAIAVSLTFADATHAHGIDAFALTSDHALVLADSLLAHSADALTLTTGVAFFGAINEVTPNDETAIWTVTPGSYVEFGLTSVTDPTVDTGHTIRYRAQRTTAQASIKIGVYQNTTLIEEWTDSLDAALTTIAHTIASGNAANITDYSQLRVRLTALAQ